MKPRLASPRLASPRRILYLAQVISLALWASPRPALATTSTPAALKNATASMSKKQQLPYGGITKWETKPIPKPYAGPPRPVMTARGTATKSRLAAAVTATHQAEDACLLKLEAAASALKSAKLVKTPVGAATLATVAAQCKLNKSGTGSVTIKPTANKQLLKAAGGTTTQAAAANITYDPTLNNCVDSSRTLCADPDVMHFVRETFSVSAGATLTIKTYNLQGLLGSSPDTVLYLIKCDTAACEAGDIVEADDDGNGDTPWNPGDPMELNRDSKIEISAPAAGIYVVYVISWDAGSPGTTDLSIVQPGGVNILRQGTVFSGWQIEGQELRTGDIFAAARNPGPPSMSLFGYEVYHDSKLLALSTRSRDCTNCGRAQFVDDTFYGSTQASRTYLARMTIDAALGSPTDARVVVGVYNDGMATVRNMSQYYRMNVRLAHLRRSTVDGGAWTHAGATDSDQDGLTEEVEEQLGSCDTTQSSGKDVIIDGFSCANARDFVNGAIDEHNDITAPNNTLTKCAGPGSVPSQNRCWQASDTDNDGISDAAEFFAVVAGCVSSPSGPYGEATCDKPNPLTATCGAGQWCVVEPNGLAPLASPFYDHEPTVYDIYVKADYLRSTVWSESVAAHRLTDTQLDQLYKMWQVEPHQCWDGSEIGTCPGLKDLRYRVQMHAYPGDSWGVGDDRFLNEIIKVSGPSFAASHYYDRFDGAMRYAGVSRFALASHTGPSGAALGHVLWWGNRGENSQQVKDGLARRPFSHEVGHTLSRYHQHFDGAKVSQSCCSDNQSLPNTCQPAPPHEQCSTAMTCGTAWRQSMNVSSVMSYQTQRLGMFPKQAAPPSGSDTPSALCSKLNYRFSKGLQVSIDESDLSNTLLPGGNGTEWQLRRLAQDMFCYTDMNQCHNNATYALFKSDGTRQGPYCDVDAAGAADKCYFNWEGSMTPPTDLTKAKYAHDLTAGRWTSSATDSDRDRLPDLNEWSGIIALGKDRLSSVPSRDLCLYGNTFGGAKVDDDYCGWSETITASNVIASEVNYPVSGCEPGSAGCKMDTCVNNNTSTCRGGYGGQTCSSDVCSCQADSHCFSGQCVGGACVTAWGGTPCTVGSDCSGQGNPTCVLDQSGDGVCNGFTPAATIQPQQEAAQPWSVLASAGFNGNDSRLRLHAGSDSRLEAISAAYANKFALYFDFRFDGFDSGETTQVLWASKAFSAVVVGASGGGAALEVAAGNHTALVYPNLQVGRWYRVVASVDKQSAVQFLRVRPWDPARGWFEPDSSAFCGWLDWTWDVPTPGDVWIGHDGGGDATRYFHGRMDNIAIYNHFAAGHTPACNQQ